MNITKDCQPQSDRTAAPFVDIRDRAVIDHRDVMALNFIRRDCPFIFRRHFRSGLRSHIFEVLEPGAVRLEIDGVVSGGIRRFPRAVPRKMLRIFRQRFVSVDQIHREILHLRIIETYLSPDQLARSNEFMVDYRLPGGKDLLLCGLQEYVEGHGFSPWSIHMDALAEALTPPGSGARRIDAMHEIIRQNARRFVDGVRRMIRHAGMVPDLAGRRNLLITDAGNIRLVDINNVSRVVFGPDIALDDKGYPVCDRSIEALIRMEEGLLGRRPDPSDPLVATFYDPVRLKEVRRQDREFHRDLKP